MFARQTTLFASEIAAYEVTSFAVDGVDPDCPWWFSFSLTDDGGVRAYAWAFLPGVDTFDPIEFVIVEADHLDPAVLAYYRKIGGKVAKQASFIGKELPEAIRRWHQDNAEAAA